MKVDGSSLTSATLPRRILALILIGLLTVPIGAPSRAGVGEIVKGKLNLLFYFAYDEDDPAAWEPVITEYSRLLLNATEGGLQLGTASLTRSPDLMDQADVWVLDDYSGARAHLNGLGQKGKHITISQLHESTGGSALGQFGLVHETGHYVWGVYDEYKGYIGNTPGVHFAHYCVSAFGDVSCVMDGGTTIFPNNQRTEFCTDYALGFPTTRHFPGTDDAQGNAIRTDQEYLLRRSCWRQIEISGVGGLTHPTDDPSGDQPAHEDVVFDYSRYDGRLGMALVLDTSGSMDAEGKLENAILGAQVGVGLLRDDEYLTVVGFADEPTVVYPIREMTEARKNEAIAAIGSLVADGGTVIGTAVIEAVDQLAQVDGGKEFLVVVTDGVSHDPDIDDPAVLDALRNGEHALFAIALGAFPDDEALLVATEATGGQYFSATNADELPGIFATIFALAGWGTTVSENFAGDLGPLDSRVEDFEVSGHAHGARVTVSFAPGADLGLVLVSPSGVSIDFFAPGGDVEVFGSAVQKTMRVPDPEVGWWKAVVNELHGRPASYDLLAFVESPELNVTTNAASESVVFPDPMQVEVSVVAGVPVGGVLVDARVVRPDASETHVGFHDDGLLAHGDEKRDDGVYSALFTSYVGDGPYVFDIEVVNVDGGAASNLECGIYGRSGTASGVREQGQVFDPIEPFTARARHTVLLGGHGEPTEPGSAHLAEHANLEPATDVDVATSVPTPVAGFSLVISPDEPQHLDRLLVDLDPRGQDVSVLEGMALHLDANDDGELDVPSVPVGIGHLVDGDRRILFEQSEAFLAMLDPAETASFLLTLGQSSGLPGAGGGTLSPPPGATPPALRQPGARRTILAGLLLLAWILSRRFTNRRRRKIATALGPIAAVILGLVLLVPSCTHDGSGGTDGIDLTVSPGGLELSGAVTGESIDPSGDALRFSFRAR